MDDSPFSFFLTLGPTRLVRKGFTRIPCHNDEEHAKETTEKQKRASASCSRAFQTQMETLRLPLADPSPIEQSVPGILKQDQYRIQNDLLLP